MPKKPAQRSSLFLLELIIAILFFILAATACVRFFVQSHTIEKESVALNQAVLAAASVAEIVRSQDEPLDIMTQIYPEGKVDGDFFYIYYDDEWNLCNRDTAYYTLSLETEYKEAFLESFITVLDHDETVYELNVSRYLNGEDAL